MRYSAAIFDIQWHNVQEGVQLTPLVLPAALNIGQAQSRGFETEISANLTDHLSGQLSYTYNPTKLTAVSSTFQFPDVSVPAPAVGTPMPGTPKNSAALGFEYGHVKFAGGDWRYAINAHYQSAVVPGTLCHGPTVAGYTWETCAELLVFAPVGDVIHEQLHQQLRGQRVQRSFDLWQPDSGGDQPAAHRRLDAGLFIQAVVSGAHFRISKAKRNNSLV